MVEVIVTTSPGANAAHTFARSKNLHLPLSLLKTFIFGSKSTNSYAVHRPRIQIAFTHHTNASMWRPVQPMVYVSFLLASSAVFILLQARSNSGGRFLSSSGHPLSSQYCNIDVNFPAANVTGHSHDRVKYKRVKYKRLNPCLGTLSYCQALRTPRSIKLEKPLLELISSPIRGLPLDGMTDGDQSRLLQCFPTRWLLFGIEICIRPQQISLREATKLYKLLRARAHPDKSHEKSGAAFKVFDEGKDRFQTQTDTVEDGPDVYLPGIPPCSSRTVIVEPMLLGWIAVVGVIGFLIWVFRQILLVTPVKWLLWLVWSIATLPWTLVKVVLSLFTRSSAKQSDRPFAGNRCTNRGPSQEIAPATIPVARTAPRRYCMAMSVEPPWLPTVRDNPPAKKEVLYYTHYGSLDR